MFNWDFIHKDDKCNNYKIDLDDSIRAFIDYGSFVKIGNDTAMTAPQIHRHHSN